MSTNRLTDNLSRDLFVLEDESNPRNSNINRIWPPTILDQVFDQLSPTNKNLREILADLKQEIITGGVGNIIFPVTDINGKAVHGSDIWLNAADFGLGKVDNTRDADKPLSVPQRNSIMEILAGYNFNVNMDQFYEHLLNNDNPHSVNIDQINKDEILTTFVNRLITTHSQTDNTSIHTDIRRNLSKLWNLVENLDQGLEARIGKVLNIMDDHLDDRMAHDDIFRKKENIVNKSMSFTTTNDNNHTKYPSTKAVVDFVTQRFNIFKESFPDINNGWITDIQVINSQEDLPPADIHFHRKGYILVKGLGYGNQNAIAICRQNSSGDYFWDVSDTGSVSQFDPTFFIQTENGLSLNLLSILATNADIDSLFTDVPIGGGNTAGSIYDLFLKGIKILPGTIDGHIRYYINNDPSTMSDDIKVAGLQSLAYREYVTENEIWENAVQNRHLLSRSVDSRVLKEKTVTRNHLVDDLYRCAKGNLLGNIMNTDGTIHEVNLVQLGDLLRPIIGGWDDPTSTSLSGTEGTRASVNSPHLWEPGVEQIFSDGSRGIRFTGRISVLPNQQIIIPLEPSPSNYSSPGFLPITSQYHRLLSTGGSWCTDHRIRAWSSIGGSNLTGHTFADVSMDERGIKLDSISIGDRIDAPYDVWILYLPGTEDQWITGEWYDDPNQYQPLVKEDTPSAEINYITENLIGLTPSAIYIIDGVEYTTNTNGTILIRSEWFNKYISIIRKGNDITTKDSNSQYISIVARPFAPTGIGKIDTIGGQNNGSITGLTSNMEFKLNTITTWINVTAPITANLSVGNYNVRVKATTTLFASEITNITIN